jgi:hypothetical protein
VRQPWRCDLPAVSANPALRGSSAISPDPAAGATRIPASFGDLQHRNRACDLRGLRRSSARALLSINARKDFDIEGMRLFDNGPQRADCRRLVAFNTWLSAMLPKALRGALRPIPRTEVPAVCRRDRARPGISAGVPSSAIASSTPNAILLKQASRHAGPWAALLLQRRPCTSAVMVIVFVLECET